MLIQCCIARPYKIKVIIILTVNFTTHRNDENRRKQNE